MNKMIKISIGAMLVFSLGIFSSCGGGEEEATHDEVVKTAVSAENLVVVDYGIEGMVCAMGCAATIQEEVAAMDGIALCDVDFEMEKAHVEFDKTVVSEMEIISKIESIADGQYKVGEWVEKKEEVEEEGHQMEEDGEENAEESITEVSLPTFEIPNLFTLLIDQL